MAKISKIILYVCAGLFCLYLLIGFVVLPLTLQWAIGNKGTELLKHPVRAGAVAFNPFLWQLTIKNFQILDDQKNVMAGFDRLSVDVSFTALLKKTYRIESLNLDGLNLNVVLLPDGHLNLMDLIPKDSTLENTKPGADNTQVPASSAAPSTVSPQTAATSAVLPVVIVDLISMEQGQVHFIDQTVQPNFQTALTGIQTKVTGASTLPDSEVTAKFLAHWDEKATIGSKAVLKPFAKPLQLDASLTLTGYGLTVATPYTGKYTGRTVKDGKLDFNMVYRIADNKITASHKILVQRFGFGDKVDSKDALSLPFGLAIALLEDPHGRINISLPVNGDMSDPKFHYGHVLSGVVRNFFVKLMTKPFAILGSVLGASEESTEELGYVRFVAGAVEIREKEKVKLKALMDALTEHPKLLLRVNGAYDPDVDWKAIKTRSFEREYELLRTESRDTEGWALQHLYQRHFGIRALWALTKSYKSKRGVYDEENLNKEIRKQLIANSPVDKAAVEALAMERAQAVYDFMITAGFEKERMSIGTALPIQSSAGIVPLELSLITTE